MRIVALSFVCLLALLGASWAVGRPESTKLDFDRDVRPILSENCFKCHGPDANARQAGLRLDSSDGAYKKLDSTHTAVMPGSLEKSELYHRITSPDSRKMPPPASGKKLTPRQIETLKEWILQGGKYGAHWAFVPPRRPAVPALPAWVGKGSGSRVEGLGSRVQGSESRGRPHIAASSTRFDNPIDRFILKRLNEEGLRPSPEADRRTLIRRVSLDLTGLPPTIKEVDDFLNDRSPNAYEKVVDRLLASSHYGERMALQWLDLARYADTHGYHIDSHRDMWRWRDWVIDAYNRNMPYDQFVIKQIAGDLLPNPTLEDRIATGFNRNHPINFEGGAIPEEYHCAYIEDRIDTTATAFLGLTLRCGQCHDHKFDPFTSKDYYRFFAFFNNVPEEGLDGTKGNAKPFIKAPLPGQIEELEKLKKTAGAAELAVKNRAAEAAPLAAVWESKARAELESAIPGLSAEYLLDDAGSVKDSAGKHASGKIEGAVKATDGKFGKALSFEGGHVQLGADLGFDRNDKVSYGAWIFPTSNEHGAIVSRMDGPDSQGWDLYLGDAKVFVHLIHTWESNAIRVNSKQPLELNKWHHIFVTYDGSSKAKGVRVYVDGKPIELEITHDSLTDSIKIEKPAQIGRRGTGAMFKGSIQQVRFYDRELSGGEVVRVAGIESLRPLLAGKDRSKAQQEAIARYYLDNVDEEYRKLNTALADARKKQEDFDSSIPTTMVMEEMPKPRDTFMLLRGQYDKHGDKVTCGTPASLNPMPTGAPNNRLGLAMWLVDPQNPLTARVAVNRYWQMLFGTGLVRTAENFGTQGERPSHPELLDWLATTFIHGSEPARTASTAGFAGSQFAVRQWNIKDLIKLIVMSATYRQSSRMTPELEKRDPENLLLARGPRFRLPGEMVRDQALAVSGLLVPKIGGPSVRPYQPPGLWEEMAFGGGFSAQSYVQDHGENLYRRGMYIFWKRTVPPVSLQTFDAPEREFCIVRRSVTNTPLQALVLMNDPTYVEAARKFAERILTEPPADARSRIRFAYQSALSRPATEKESALLEDVLRPQIVRFNKDQAAAAKLLGVGESPRNERLNMPELAAWTTIASMILNLDETITKN